MIIFMTQQLPNLFIIIVYQCNGIAKSSKVTVVIFKVSSKFSLQKIISNKYNSLCKGIKSGVCSSYTFLSLDPIHIDNPTCF